MLRSFDVRSALLSLAILASILAVWQITTHVPDTGSLGVVLSQDQMGRLLDKNMSSEDIEFYTSQGVAFLQLEQIASLNLSRKIIDAAGGIRALGISVPDENSAPAPGSLFPSPAKIGIELWATVTDPFYVAGTNDMG